MPRKLVVVAVMLPSQARELKKRTRHLDVDLRCLTQDSPVGRFPQGTQEVVILSRFTSHTWQRVAYSQFPRDRVHLHHGGMNTAVDTICRLAGGAL